MPKEITKEALIAQMESYNKGYPVEMKLKDNSLYAVQGKQAFCIKDITDYELEQLLNCVYHYYFHYSEAEAFDKIKGFVGMIRSLQVFRYDAELPEMDFPFKTKESVLSLLKQFRAQ